MTTILTNKLNQKRKFLLILPVFAIPALFIVFFVLGGGKGSGETLAEKAPGMGFNMELPPPIFDKKEEKMSKMDFYNKADEDSARKRALRMLDPHADNKIRLTSSIPEWTRSDTQSDGLLKRLDLLKHRIAEPVATKPSIHRTQIEDSDMGEGPVFPTPQISMSTHQAKDTGIADPELDRLEKMLDKITRLQQSVPPEEEISHAEKPKIKTDERDSALPAAIPATVDQDQELSNGATLALRLTVPISYCGIRLPKGQLVYGMASLTNDRLQVSIHSIRCGQSILTTAWQVYDMDGLPGIRVPDALGRQVAKQSAEQNLASLNLAGYDPSIGAQVANAGIQTARNFFSRKFRAIRVTVPAGYQLLLKDVRISGSALQMNPNTVADGLNDLSKVTDKMILPPSIDSFQPYLHESIRDGKIRFMLRGVYHREGLQWLYLAIKNGGRVGFYPGFIRCNIQQRRHLKRMAIQELPVQLLYDSLPSVVASDEESVILIAMRPFNLSKDKRLRVLIGEKYGTRAVQLKIDAHSWLKMQ